ncbi:hypothetical protein CK203_065668 [Vitis vinifera]|uniref:Transposon Ty3-I Gag-Pol polyprotein n=1 Tax=Vitis vinifera TaxID=29760 RepID=A0A438G9C2_VITVI|nr:hypothetical protein CK203_065668 [Vitis vinifera]
MLSRIDQIVDTTSGYGMLSFLNDFFGYHKIPMHSLDTEKTTFITPQGLYCYKVMGIEVNPAQVKVVLETPVPTSKKKHRLTGHLATLGQFIAYFTDKLCLFFITLQGANIFGWTDECKHTFEAIKCYLAELPILSSPKANEELYMYLAVSDCAISVMLFWHIQSSEQTHLLLEQSYVGCGNVLFPSRVNNLSVAICHQKASPVLSSSSNNCLDQPIAMDHIAQARLI